MSTHTKLLGFTAGSVVALGVIVLMLASYAYGGVSGFFAAQSLSEEIRGARFVSSTGGYYQWTPLGFKKSINEQTQDVRELLAEHTEIATVIAPAISPDKTMLAYIAPSDDMPVVRVLGPGATERTIGAGTGPFFVTDTILARFTSNGLVFSSLSSTSDEQVVLERTSEPSYMRYDAESRLLAVQEGRHRVGIYRVAHTFVQYLGAYTGEYESFEITNDALYVLRNSEQGTDIMRATISQDVVGEPTVIGTLPAALAFAALHL